MDKGRLFLILAVFDVFIMSECLMCKSPNKVNRPDPDGICKSIEIKNNNDDFKKLENCTVIEGHLRITLIRDLSFNNYSFPKLREITDYLMVYRVWGLKTLGKLFPNLAVIRGHVPFHNYALVVYEVQDLEELGLSSLSRIGNGVGHSLGVRLTKNKKLCYIHTVDWARLGVSKSSQDFKENKDVNLCPEFCPEKCSTTIKEEGKRCWNAEHCQKNLNCTGCNGGSCMVNGTCCHKECLGGCFKGSSIKDCISCKKYSYKNKCFEECPPHTYQYFQRRCLTDRECLSLEATVEGKPKILKGEGKQPNQCVFQCPENYMVSNKNYTISLKNDTIIKNKAIRISDNESNEVERDNLQFTGPQCVKCNGPCPKVCKGSIVQSLEQAVSLKGCSKILGDLIIQIHMANNVANELMSTLGNIQEITGTLTIKSSTALLTLYFLKSLKIIGGTSKTSNNKYALTVTDNPKLIELFPSSQLEQFTIKNGSVWFERNRKLCEKKIETFVKNISLNLKPNEQYEKDNGDLVPCYEKQLDLNVSTVESDEAILEWEKDTSANPKALLSYNIYYREMQDNDETEVRDLIYEGRDACSDNLWASIEKKPEEDSKPTQHGTIEGLKPFTKYAVFVQAYKISSQSAVSAQTKVKYFTTMPTYPSEPRELIVETDLPNELTIKWDPPKHPNGIVTHYKVIYRKLELNHNPYKKRDYCINPMGTAEVKRKKIKTPEVKTIQDEVINANCCPCAKSKSQKEAEERMQKIEIYFETYLHQHVYCQREDTLPEFVKVNISWPDLINGNIIFKKIKFNLEAELQKMDGNIAAPYDTEVIASSDNRNISDDNSLEAIVYNTTTATLPNLDHFQEYGIEVLACQNTTEQNSVESKKYCSLTRAITVGRTKADPKMDSLNESLIEWDVIGNATGEVLIKWHSPDHPNGLIVKYEVYYKRVNQENAVADRKCVNVQKYIQLKGFRLNKLDPGNYSFQIEPWSLAGKGTRTSEKFFVIPLPPGEEKTPMTIIMTIILVVFIILICVSVFLFCTKRRFKQQALTVISPNINYVPSDEVYDMDDWEVERDNVKLLKELGQGSFGMVYEGIATGLKGTPNEELRVAVKTVNNRASFDDKREFLKEATIMKAFNCFHVVKLLGVVSTMSANHPALVIMELMALGDLKNYLRLHRPDEYTDVTPPNLLDILQMAGEIADGMAYLAHKRVVHRDLAARNCMVADDKTVKIGDFGMTRDIYETDYYRKGGKGMLPVRWMAPESLKDGVFTTKSDVWSYGVVMWEMVTLAAQPYQGLSNEEVVRYISEGSTMDIPQKCPEKMAYLMEHCWTKRPKDRPSFMNIVEYLLRHMNERFESVSYFYNDGGGPSDPDAEGTLPEHKDFDPAAGSEDSLSCEGAAASRPSTSGGASGGYQFKGSGDNYLYDEGSLQQDGYSDEDDEEENFYPPSYPPSVDFRGMGDERDDYRSSSDREDVRQPFMCGDFDIDASRLSRPPSFTTSAGERSSAHSSGLIELQPLISRDKNMNNPYLPYKPLDPFQICNPPPLSSSNVCPHTSSSTMDSGPSGLQLSVNSPTDSPAAPANLIWAQRPPIAQPTVSSPSPPTTSSRNGAHPTRKLPPLNDPPGRGRPQVPFSSGANNSSFKTRNPQKNSSGLCPSPLTQTNARTVNVEVGMGSVQDSSRTCRDARDLCESSTGGAVTSSSEDGSKESSKSSGSHSLLNGLTNGNVPLAYLRNRTSPC